MIESDIQNITSDCHQEIIEVHSPDCTCDCCCEVVAQNCQQDLDQCGDNPQLTERRLEMKSKLGLALLNTGLLLLVLGVSTAVANARDNASGDVIRAKITTNTASIVDATRTGGIIVGHADEVAKQVIAEDGIENVDRHASIVVGHSPVNTIGIDEDIVPVVPTGINAGGIRPVKSEILHPIDAIAPIQHHLKPAIRS
jgi:hypothetical protein